MSNPAPELQPLLNELKFRVPAADITPADHEAICAFLRQEREARTLHRLQRLFAASGIGKNQWRTFEQFDWNFNHAVPRDRLLAFRSSPWISSAANLILIGDAGIGKSHLAKAFCYNALQQGHSVYFSTAFDLVSKIKRARSCSAKIDFYGKVVRLLCLDELGYTVYPKEDTDILFQIISKRCETLPTIVTTNLPPKKWGSIVSGPAASAILDRLGFNGTFLTWEGASYRVNGKHRT
jgi:DNA replication protein DnaC